MYLPRSLISKLYNHLAHSNHSLSPAVLILVALEPDALCACRILTALLKRDYVPHKIQPVSGYNDLAGIGQSLVQPMCRQNGGSGGTVICLGVGGLVDVGQTLGFDPSDETDPCGGVEVWLIDARRPWNLGNVFAGSPQDPPLQEISGNSRSRTVQKGQILSSYKPGRGGIIVYDDGDIHDELDVEANAYFALSEMQDVGEVEDGSDESDGDLDAESEEDEATDTARSNKRKSWSDRGGEDSEDDDEENRRPRQRRRSNSNQSVPSTLNEQPQHSDGSRHSRPTSPSASVPQGAVRSSPPAPSARTLRRRFKRLRRKHWMTLQKYYDLGASYSEPISSLLYSLAEDLGREDNDMLWWAIVGVSSLELYGRTMTGVAVSTALDAGGSAGWGGARGQHVRQALRDEVRRLNPPDLDDSSRESLRGEASDVIPTTGRSPNDHAIRLSPEPRFLLIRHWSLYDSMLHSPYLGSRLHIWNDAGRKRLHKLLAKMGISLSQCRQSYTHMDMDLKRGLRQKLLSYAPLYGLDGLVPPKAANARGLEGWGFVRCWGWKACLSAMDVGVIIGAILEVGKSGAKLEDGASTRGWDRNRGDRPAVVDEDGKLESEEWVRRFWEAYDALNNIEALKKALPTAQHLHRAILRTGTSLIEKRQIRHLKAFRMAVVKEGPDVALFTHPSALTKLALWVGEAIAEQEREKDGKDARTNRSTPLVLAGLNESRGVFVVVGTGGGGGVIDIEARAKRKQRLEEKAKAKEAKREEKERRKSEKKAEKRQAKQANGDVDDDGNPGDEDGDEDDEESEDDESENSEEEESDDDDGDDSSDPFRKARKNRFGIAFQEVIDETRARVRIDSFDNCVVEVKKEDLSGFLESLSTKTVVG